MMSTVSATDFDPCSSGTTGRVKSIVTAPFGVLKDYGNEFDYQTKECSL